jgi:hypothetical protein
VVEKIWVKVVLGTKLESWESSRDLFVNIKSLEGFSVK